MLTELKKTSQIPGEWFRRWFSDKYMDLIVWFDDDHTSIKGFQLCYVKGKEEKALTWRQEEGYTHTTLDSGEENIGRHKMTPVLFPNGAVNNQSLLQLFLENSQQLDSAMIDFISIKIKECPSNIT